MPETNGRERILARVRAALAKPGGPVPTPAPRPVFAAVTNPLERFQAECAGNYTDCVMAANSNALVDALQNIVSVLPPGEVFIQDTPQLRALAGKCSALTQVRWSSEGGPREASQATVSEAELLVASTGSILVSSSCGGRGASVVAPVHIVVARKSQMVPDLQTAMARADAAKLGMNNSFVGLITGCSRTADIEKLLVIGAHGPRRLAVLVQADA